MTGDIKSCCAGDLSYDPVKGLIWLDGTPLFQLITVEGQNSLLNIRFFDGNRPRSAYRGACYLEMPLGEFLEKLQSLAKTV